MAETSRKKYNTGTATSTVVVLDDERRIFTKKCNYMPKCESL